VRAANQPSGAKIGGRAGDSVPDEPLVIEFAPGTSIVREHDLTSDLPILRNGPPGTFVVFPNLRVSLPTDQIVRATDEHGHAEVAFGGMRFEGITGGRLIFVRVRELHPEEQLSPDRSHVMKLEPEWVVSIRAGSHIVWQA
jgi:hypothetical protein